MKFGMRSVVMRVKVAIAAFQGRLRLRWSYQKQRYCMTLGLDDTVSCRVLAQNRVLQIEKDIELDNFDHTLERYQPSAKGHKAAGISAVTLFEQFTTYKRKTITDRTAVKYASVAAKVAVLLGGKSAAIDDDMAADFRLALARDVSPDTQRTYLFLMKACWDWGVKRKLITHNPWGEVLSGLRVPPRQPPEAFSKAETLAILNGFSSSQRYSYYTDFVTFLLGCGCRPGEAIGLCWKHLSEDCHSIWIGESVSRGLRGPSKTAARSFKLTTQLQTMLLKRRPEDWQPDGLVFPAVEGGAIDDGNFCSRAWKTVLKDAGVSYKSPYTTRRTFVSHALRQQHPEDVARMSGHDVDTMRSHYAADVSDGLTLPDILG
jgi:integrase